MDFKLVCAWSVDMTEDCRYVGVEGLEVMVVCVTLDYVGYWLVGCVETVECNRIVDGCALAVIMGDDLCECW